MTNIITSKLNKYVQKATESGLSGKAASVYVVLLAARIALSPKAIIIKSKLHRQYVYTALEELSTKQLIAKVGEGRSSKYQAQSPDILITEVEKKRIDILNNVATLMDLYREPHDGVVEIISGSQACIESELKLLEESEIGETLDIIGGAGMRFVEQFAEHIGEYKLLQAEKKLHIRYIGGLDDVTHNMTAQALKNESRMIEGIENIVNVCIRPDSISFNIYEPEIVTIRVKSKAAVISQRALFEVLWGIAKKL
jgi:sugar-specific transcriptional regulator TrmB